MHLAILVLVAVSLLVSVEVFWKSRGGEPNYVDDPRRWAYFRDQVDSLTDPNSTILIGGSRIQLGWSMATFRSVSPETPIIQLSITGIHPFAVLRDLSTNTNFAGIVVVGLTAGGILPKARKGARSHVEFYENSWTLNNKLNFLIEDYLQQYLITRQSRHGLLKTIAAILVGHRQRGGNYIETTRERERSADYRGSNIEAIRAERVRRVVAGAAKFQPPKTAVWDKSARQLDRIVRSISQRGGRVVFIRPPTSGVHWEFDEKMFPRQRYWDDLARSVSGDWVHFKDVDGLDRFDLPDTSHLDKRDKAEFTRLIIAKLQALGVYRR